MDAHQSHETVDRFTIIERILGMVLLFVGFIPVLLSLSGGFEVGVSPFLMFLSGIILLAHSAFHHWSRWLIVAVAGSLSLAILVHGRVELWHKQLLFAVAGVFLFYVFVSTDKKHTPS